MWGLHRSSAIAETHHFAQLSSFSSALPASPPLSPFTTFLNPSPGLASAMVSYLSGTWASWHGMTTLMTCSGAVALLWLSGVESKISSFKGKMIFLPEPLELPEWQPKRKMGDLRIPIRSVTLLVTLQKLRLVLILLRGKWSVFLGWDRWIALSWVCR